MRRALFLLLPALLLVGVWTPAPRAAAADDLGVRDLKVGPISQATQRIRRWPSFYRQQLDLGGFPVLASAKADGRALLEAAWIVRNMLAKRPDLLRTLRRRGIRVSVMAHDELTTQVPEHADLVPAKWWDYRARGLGAGPRRPVVSCGEENLLGYRGDPYAGESILLHEFAHAVDTEALRLIDKDFAKTLRATYKAALREGLWKNCYAATNVEEYWAEGVQCWYDANRPPDALHNDVNTREELRAYDPRLAALIAKSFGNNPWRYRPPAQRLAQGHLKGYESAKAPVFIWPSGLEGWYWAYERKKATGTGLLALPALRATAEAGRSPVTRGETRILFVNQTEQEVRIYWLGYDGRRRPYGTLQPGTHGERATLVRHIWLITNDQGKELARFRAATKPGRALVTAPAAPAARAEPAK